MKGWGLHMRRCETDPLRCIEACIENRSIERETTVYTLYIRLSLSRLACVVYSVYSVYSVYTIQRIQCTTLYTPSTPVHRRLRASRAKVRVRSGSAFAHRGPPRRLPRRSRSTTPP